MVSDEQRIHGVMRGSPPCRNCEERHTACHDKCTKYHTWKDEVHRIKEVKKAYKETCFNDYKEENRRQAWRRKTF
jgi:hypothetical protein